MKKPEKDSLTDKIFFFLIDKSVELFDLSMTIMFDPKELTRGMGMYTSYHSTPASFYKKVNNLKNSPYFTVKDDKFYLSARGRTEIIKIIIKGKHKVQKWDGKWWAIIFDIPEASRKQRNFLRRELKWMGFRELQHSIWIFPFDIEKELLTLLKLWQKDFRGDVRLLKIEKMIDDKDCRKIFDL